MSQKPTTINSNTKLAAIIGNPVAQSLSPTIHNAVFRALDIDWLYLAFLVESNQLQRALEALPALGIVGLSVTMPHKNEVARIVSEIGEVDEIVCKTKSANTVMLRADKSLFATNTDGQGCCNAIEMTANVKIAGSQVVVIGAGGTASAVVYSLLKNGAKEVVVFNRTVDRARVLTQMIGGSCRVIELNELPDEVRQAQIIVNTTPVGFNPSGVASVESNSMPIDARLINSKHLVVDAVYRPLTTPLLAAAQKVGAKTVDGLEMLVHQAALQQQVWLGRSGETKLMRDAALKSF